MKGVKLYVFIGLLVLMLYWTWIVFFPAIFTGLTWDMALVVGTGAFLSFEMVILAGVIISKINNK